MKQKKLKIFITILVGFFLFFGVVARAEDKYGLNKTAGAAELPKTVAGSADATSLVGAIVKIALDLSGIIFFALILLAGFRWMTARDNSDVIDKSKNTIEHAVVGLIIVLAAYAITNFIFQGLSASGTSNPSVDSSTGLNNGTGSCAGTCESGTCASGETEDGTGSPYCSSVVTGAVCCVGASL